MSSFLSLKTTHILFSSRYEASAVGVCYIRRVFSKVRVFDIKEFSDSASLLNCNGNKVKQRDVVRENVERYHLVCRT